MTTFLLPLLACLPILHITALGAGDDLYVNITLLQTAECLDGSPLAYYFDKGFDTGISNWIIYLQGGGWCDSISECQEHAIEHRGSSKYMKNQSLFAGILHNTPQKNPVCVNYCDGSSFTADIEHVDPEKKLYFRGARIFKAVLQEMWSKRMQNAKNAILSGSSAGGLATILNCDKFKSFFSNDSVKVNNTISGSPNIQKMYQRIVTLHESAKNLPSSCISTMEPSLCFFPQHVVPYVETPLFIINSAYDAWQINNTLVPSHLDHQQAWEHCKVRLNTLSQRIIIEDFGVEFLKTFFRLTPCYIRGYFITSCHTHAQIVRSEYWFSTTFPRILNKTIAEAVGDWYFDRTEFHQYLDPYPCARDCF